MTMLRLESDDRRTAVVVVPESTGVSGGAGPLANLFDRPVLHHVMAVLSGNGFTHVHLICADPGPVRRSIGDGSRWGVVTRVHAPLDGEAPLSSLTAVEALGSGPVLLAAGDRIATLLDVPSRLRDAAVRIDSPDDGSWSGWTWVEPEVLQYVAALSTLDRLEEWLGRFSFVVAGAPVLKAGTEADLLVAHQKVLGEGYPHVIVTGTQALPGIWMGRKAVVDQSVRMEAPVWIGGWARVAQGVTLGPGAVIGGGAIVDRGSTVRHAVVSGGTYLGAGLEISDAVAVGDAVVNVRLGGAARPGDPRILTDIGALKPTAALTTPLQRLFAAMLLVIGAPAAVLAALLVRATRRGALLWRRPFEWSDQRAERAGSVLTFAPYGYREIRTRLGAWRDVVLYFLPGLVSVLRGELALVGVAPRTAVELQELPPMAAGVGKAKPGLIHESLVQGVASADGVGILMADLMHLADPERRSAPRTLLRYLARGFRR